MHVIDDLRSGRFAQPFRFALAAFVVVAMLVLVATGGSPEQPPSTFALPPSEQPRDGVAAADDPEATSAEPRRARARAKRERDSAGAGANRAASDDPPDSEAKKPARASDRKPPAEREEEDPSQRLPVPVAEPAPEREQAAATPISRRLRESDVRALGRPSLALVTGSLGEGLAESEMAREHGPGPVAAMLRQEPIGAACRYYELAPSEAAPYVRLCFAAGGRMLSTEFVAPLGAEPTRAKDRPSLTR